jgi:hypothetical protein
MKEGQKVVARTLKHVICHDRFRGLQALRSAVFFWRSFTALRGTGEKPVLFSCGFRAKIVCHNGIAHPIQHPCIGLTFSLRPGNPVRNPSFRPPSTPPHRKARRLPPPSLNRPRSSPFPLRSRNLPLRPRGRPHLPWRGPQFQKPDRWKRAHARCPPCTASSCALRTGSPRPQAR